MWIAVTALGALAIGFALGAFGAAWNARNQRAEPWRSMHVEHEGGTGAPTRTRIIFADPKLPLQAVEVQRSSKGKPKRAHVDLVSGEVLTINYGDEKSPRPSAVEGANGGRASISYKSSKATVTIAAPDGTELGKKSVRIPPELRAALRVAVADRSTPSALAQLWDTVTATELIASAHAAREKDDSPVTVQREMAVTLDVLLPSGRGVVPGVAQVESSCAPFTCLPLTTELDTPGKTRVVVGVSSSVARTAIKKPAGGSVPARYEKAAREERAVAATVLPDAQAAVAAVAITALACRSLKLSQPICVKGLGKQANVAGAAIISIGAHNIKASPRGINKRAWALYAEEQARAKLDKKARVEVCVRRKGYSRACAKFDGRPFGVKPMGATTHRLTMKRGISGELTGSFELTQSDGNDCKFSPSPKTTGVLRMSFDNKRGVVSAKLNANKNGTRPNLRCSLGSANMRWSQRYNLTATQTFTPEQLLAGGKLPLLLKGTMAGSGDYSFSGCRTSSGGSADCPGGKRESYNYPVELIGTIDLDTQSATGRIAVHNAPLNTRGTWRVPAAGASQ